MELHSIPMEYEDVSQDTKWYEKKTLVKEVFYMQAILVFVVIVSSIINIARDIPECDKQVWMLMLSTGIAHMLPSPGIGKDLKSKVNNSQGIDSGKSDSRSIKSRINLGKIFYKRTSQHREIFYVQSILIFIVVLSSIVFLSIGIGEKNILIVLLSASFAHFLPAPSFIQMKSTIQ